MPNDKHPGGRPPIFDNCLDFSFFIEMYFDDCDSKEEPYLIVGISQALNMTTETLRAYGEKQEFSAIVKKAKEKCSFELSKRSIINPHQATGCLFQLKCNHGHKETSKVEHTGEAGGPIVTETKGLSAVELAQAYADVLRNNE